MSNQVGDCFKFLWPFQNVRTLLNAFGGGGGGGGGRTKSLIKSYLQIFGCKTLITALEIHRVNPFFFKLCSIATVVCSKNSGGIIWTWNLIGYALGMPIGKFYV